jgi:hypothetical protein
MTIDMCTTLYLQLSDENVEKSNQSTVQDESEVGPHPQPPPHTHMTVMNDETLENSLLSAHMPRLSRVAAPLCCPGCR